MRKYYYIAGFLLLTLGMSGSFVRAEESRLPERRGMGDVLSDTLVWTVCDSAYSWRGHTYSATGVYTDTVFEALPGVDSVYVLSLTVNHSTSRITNASACDRFYWHGVIYTESTDTPTFVRTNSVGCDSVIHLHLTIRHGTHDNFYQHVCESYVWQDYEFTMSGEYVYDYINNEGCPSSDTLHLTVDNHNSTSYHESELHAGTPIIPHRKC